MGDTCTSQAEQQHAAALERVSALHAQELAAASNAANGNTTKATKALEAALSAQKADLEHLAAKQLGTVTEKHASEIEEVAKRLREAQDNTSRLQAKVRLACGSPTEDACHAFLCCPLASPSNIEPRCYFKSDVHAFIGWPESPCSDKTSLIDQRLEPKFFFCMHQMYTSTCVVGCTGGEVGFACKRARTGIASRTGYMQGGTESQFMHRLLLVVLGCL